MRGLRIAGALALLGVGVAAGIWALSPRAASILIEAGRAAPVMATPGAPLGVTLTIRNTGGPDRLLSISSREAARMVLAGADDPAGLAIPAGGTPSLALDGAHGMLMGLEGTAEPGRLLPVTLAFAEAGTVTARLRLDAAPDEAGDGMAMAGHGMHGAELLEVAASEAPAVALSVTPEGDGWRVIADTTRFRFAPEAMDGPHAPGEGHGHLYLGGLKLGRMTGPETTVGALPPGRHRLRLTLNTNDHRAYALDGTPIAAEVEITAP
ncbi:MAG: copper chaperone PCu(A)C [Pseudomonadota bacterium]